MTRKRTLVVLLVVVAVVSCCFAQTASAKKAPPPTHRTAVTASVDSRGFAFGEYEVSTPERAHQAMSDVVALHGNTVRVMISYNDPMSLDDKAAPASQLQLDEACNAVQAAQDVGVSQVVLDPILKKWLWPKLGDQIAAGRYNAALEALIDKAVSCMSSVGLNRPQLGVMVGNEPNSGDFCGYQDPGQNQQNPQPIRHKMCAPEAAQLYKYAVPLIRAKASFYHLDISVYIYGISSHSDPLGFTKLFCTAISSMGLSNNVLWSGVYIGVHPYTLSGTTDYLSGYRLADKVFALLQAPTCLGPNVQKAYTEAGDESVTDPLDPQYSYNEPATVPTLAPNQIGTAAYQELQWAAQHGVTVYWHFLIKDEADRRRWQSGVEKPDGQYKWYKNADGTIGSVFNDLTKAFTAFAPPPSVGTSTP